MRTINSSSNDIHDQIQTVNELQRIHPENKLNVWMPLCTIQTMKVWVQGSVEDKHWNVSKSEQEVIFKEKVQKLFDDQNTFRKKYYKRADTFIKPVGFTMDAKQYLFYCIREVVKELSLNMNDDSEIQEKLQQFRRNFVQIRYKSGDHKINLSNSIGFIDELLDTFHLIGQDSYAIHLKPYLQLCSDLIQCEDLLEFSIPNLFSKTNITRTRLSAKILTEGYYYSAQLMIQESDRILSHVQNELEHFLSKKKNVLQFSQQLNDLLAKKKDIIMKLSEELCFRNPKDISLAGKKLVLLNNEAFYLTKPFHLMEKERTISNNRGHVNILNIMLKIARESYQDKKELVDWDQLVQVKLSRHFGVTIGKHSIEDFAMFVEFQEKILEWHQLIDGFVLPHINTMIRIHASLQQWYSQNKRNMNRLLRIYHTPTVQRSQIKTSEPSIDELMEFINSDNSGKSSRSKKKKTVRKRTKTKRVMQSKDVKVPSVSLLSEMKIASDSKTERILTIDEKIYNGLKKIILQSSTASIEKVAARQALVSLQDIQAMQMRLAQNKGSSQSSLALQTLMTLQAAYYHMEQALRLENLKKNVDKSVRLAFHNLQHQAKPLEKHGENIVYNLRMVNAWTPNTHRQMRGWQDLKTILGKEPPQVLTEIHQVIDSTIKAGVTIQKLQKYLNDTLVFTGNFFSDLDEQSVTEPVTLFSMKDSVSLDVTHLQSAAAQINKTTHSIPADSILKLTLKQVSSNLKTLQSVLTGLNRDRVSSKEFSFFVRQAFYWQGQIMEKIMQAILLKNTGKDWKKEHDLNCMYQEIFGNSSDILKNTWNKWHNVTRYPYEKDESQSGIHSLILAAEVLRDMPHLDNGYSFPNKGTLFQSKQHFISVPKELLNTRSIKKGLEEVYKTFVEFVEQTLLKELLR